MVIKRSTNQNCISQNASGTNFWRNRVKVKQTKCSCAPYCTLVPFGCKFSILIKIRNWIFLQFLFQCAMHYFQHSRIFLKSRTSCSVTFNYSWRKLNFSILVWVCLVFGHPRPRSKARKNFKVSVRGPLLFWSLSFIGHQNGPNNSTNKTRQASDDKVHVEHFFFWRGLQFSTDARPL